MKTSEQIRETRIWLFENGWQPGSPSIYVGDGGCILAALAEVNGTHKDQWQNFSECDAAKAVREAIQDLHPRFERDRNLLGVRDPGEVVYTFNDANGRKFDEIVEVLELAEKKAMVREEVNDA